jgi:SAM-dependent methyltransferase
MYLNDNPWSLTGRGFMYQSIKTRGRAASDHYAGTQDYFNLSPAGLTLLDALKPFVRKYCRGSVLDVGAGRGAYKSLLEESTASYLGMDMSARNTTDVVGDIQALPFSDASFDTVFCSQVLEHVPDHQAGIFEIHRILKPGGCFIMSVPHISWLHNEPHDYFRFTKYGLRVLFAREGWEVENIVPAGGLFSLLGHVVSTMLINSTFRIPLLHPLARCVNKLVVGGAVILDRVLEKKKIFALNYVAVCRKKNQ